MDSDESMKYEYLNLTDASAAEKDIIHQILFENPNATLAQNVLFANLKPYPKEITSGPVVFCDKIQRVSDPVDEEIVSEYQETEVPVPVQTVTSFGVIPSSTVTGINGHPVPTQPQVLMVDHQNVGPHQHIRSVYTGQIVQGVPPNFIYQQIAQQQYAPPGTYLAHLNQHPHLNHQQYHMSPLAYTSHIHPQQAQQGFSSEDLGHMQKSHDTQSLQSTGSSNSSGQSGKGYNRKPQRQRRGDEPPPQMSQYSYYPGIPYGVLYNPQFAATVSNVTGQPIILPASAQQQSGPIYPPYQPLMYPGGGELEHGTLIQPPVPQIQSDVVPQPHLALAVVSTVNESLKSVPVFVPNSGPSVNGPTLVQSVTSPVLTQVPEMIPESCPVENEPDSLSLSSDSTQQSSLTTFTEPITQEHKRMSSPTVSSPPLSPYENAKSPPQEESSEQENSPKIVPSVSPPPTEAEVDEKLKPTKANLPTPSRVNSSKVEDNNSKYSNAVNGPSLPSPSQMTEDAPQPHRHQNGPPSKKEKETNLEFPQLPASNKSGGSVLNGPKVNSVSAPVGRSWASIASSRQTNGPANGLLEVGGKLQSDSGDGFHNRQTSSSSNSEVMATPTDTSASSQIYTDSFDPACLMNEDDPVALSLGEFLLKYQLNHHSFSLTPRGLVNQSNFCYINATLQSLLACPPFVNLFRSMKDIIGKIPCKATPILQSVYDFVMDFEPITRSSHNNKNKRPQDAFYVGPSLDPTGIRRVLGLLDGATFKVEGRQEDAEEFLSHLLNGLHDEMIKTIRWVEAKKDRMNSKLPNVGPPVPASANGDASGGAVEEDDEWQVMGPKNKGSMTRKTDVSKSPISEMFVGQMSSLLNRGTTPNKTTTLQPFFTLQLDIQDENIHTVRDALEGLSTKEEVSGSSSGNGQEVPMWKQLSLEFLPIILVIHLKRFVYDKSCNKIFKLDKRVDFGVDLEIGKELLSVNCKSKSYNPKQRSYKLFAAVYHDGEDAHKGHYVSDTFHPSGGLLWGQFGWIRYDDTQVKGVPESQILNPLTPRVPYLLYYRRVDTVSQSQGKKSQDSRNFSDSRQ